MVNIFIDELFVSVLLVEGSFCNLINNFYIQYMHSTDFDSKM